MTILGYDHIPRPVRARLLRDVRALRVARGLPDSADRELLGAVLAAVDAGVRDSIAAKVQALLATYYAKPGNEAGGSLHIVLDDGNIDDDDVDWCIARARERGDEDGVRLGSIIRALPRDQRAHVLGVPEGG
jgi:hypothetical protein